MNKYLKIVLALLGIAMWADAQIIKIPGLVKVDSTLSERYYRMGDIDTAYVMRPETKWTVTARMNVSGTQIRTEGISGGQHFNAELNADKNMTLSLGVNYLGISLIASLNPEKLFGKYRDYELNFDSFGKRFGFDFTYNDSKSFTGWHDQEGKGRMILPEGLLSVKTVNSNGYYVFNSRRFSYPAAFSQGYIQRRSAGSLILAASFQGQSAKLDRQKMMRLKMVNIGIGAGYGYNYVPGKGWLLHLSAMPSFIVYSNTSMTIDDSSVPLNYHFPEVIITGRGSAMKQWKNTFAGLSMVFNFTNIGNNDRLTVHNNKWLLRAFYGLRF